MIGFSQFVNGVSWNWPLLPLAIVWNALVGSPFGLWLIWLVLFALLFPRRAAFDVRHPWLKWLLLGPLIVQSVFFAVFTLGSLYDFNAIRFLAPALLFLIQVPLYTYFTFIAIGVFFALIGYKSGTSQADDRRRLRILYSGTAVSLTPMFILAVISVVSGRDILSGTPEWASISALLLLIFFPITMAYVLVIQRAMGVGMVLRQGLQYALARRGFRILRSTLLSMAILSMVVEFSGKNNNPVSRVLALCFLAAVLIFRRKFSDRLSTWIDRRFFREAYSAELVMSDLAGQTRQFTEAGPLLATVAQRVSETLHIERMAVFVRDEDSFCITQTIGTAALTSACLSPQGRSVKLLTEAQKPELIYFDDPRNWVHAAPPDEQQKLRSLHAEVLLALPGRSQLLGLMALGPKRSEEAYSPSDLRLLQLVAIQTGLALENTQLLATVALEAGKRERINRELEIAREVQERLFPQSCPAVQGIDYFGFCRPALAVGGDYYDYILRADGRLGLALGDISGKGISAALMMASLQSLLRGQIAAGLEDISVLLTNTNRLIHDVSTSNRYCTFFYSEYDPRTRKLTYVNAGHNPPIILRGDSVIRLEACGPVVGLLRGIVFTSAEFQFEPGDIFIAFTDGISEAMTADDEEWGDDRLIESARSARHLEASAMTVAIMADADRFTAGAEQHDDMTLIALKIAS
jgi:sigma-B regulation protein RsbU (phosphoserine phosphatase)